MTAAGFAGCTAADAADAADGISGTEEQSTEPALPPGVLPPNEPPQPGDARLGPDGHYDYSAPDFVPKNPCNTEYFQRALELGWKPPEIGTKRRDDPDHMYCGVVNDRQALALFTFFGNQNDLKAEGHDVVIDTSSGTPLIMMKRPTLFGEACFVGVETELGTIGGAASTGGFSDHTTIDQACAEAIEMTLPILGVNQ